MLHHPATPWHTQTKNTNQGQGTKYKSDLKSAWIKYQARWPFTAVVAQPQYWTSSGSSPSSRHPVVYILIARPKQTKRSSISKVQQKGFIYVTSYIVAIRYFYYYNCSWIVQCNVNPHARKVKAEYYCIILYICLYQIWRLYQWVIATLWLLQFSVQLWWNTCFWNLPGNFKGVQLVLHSCQGIVDHSLGCAWRTGEHSICIQYTGKQIIYT